MTSPLQRPALFWWLLIGCLTILGCAVSTVASVLVNVCALLLAPALFAPGAVDRVRREPLIVLFALAFALLAVATIVTSETPGDVIFVFNFIPLILAAAVYAKGRTLAGESATLAVLRFCLAGSLVALAVGVVDLSIRGLPRAEGVLTGALVYARLAVMLGFVASAGFFVAPDLRWRILFCIGPVAGSVAALLAQARGIFLAIPFLLAIFIGFVLTGGGRAGLRLGAAAAMLVVAAAAIAATFYFVAPDRVSQTIDVIGQVLSGSAEVERNTHLRLAYYAAGWELFQRAPLIGHGWADFAEAAATVLDAETMAAGFATFHNDFLNFAVAGGIVGIAALALILVAPLAGALAPPRDALFRPRLYVATVIVVLYLLAGLTDVTFGYDMPTTAYAMLAAVLLSVMRGEPAR